MIARCCAKKVSTSQIRHFTLNDLQHLLEEEHLVLCAQANLDSIRFLTQQIKKIEKTINKKIKVNNAFQNLLTVPGIGNIPVQLIQALPYILTVILLAGFIGHAQAPRASGIPYTKER